MLLKNSTLNYDFLKRNQKSMRTVLDRMATKKRKSLLQLFLFKYTVDILLGFSFTA